MRKRKVSFWEQFIVHFILIIASIVASIPFIWMVSTSLKHRSEIYTFPPVFIPKEINFENYKILFKSLNFGRPLLNTIIIATATPLLSILLNSMSGFAFAKFRFKLRDTLFLLILATMMIPGQMTLIPTYLIINKLGLLNTYAGIILPSVVGAGSIFFMRQFIKGIPDDLIESARIDGAQDFYIYRKIILPLAKPMIFTSLLFGFIGGWNAFLWPLIVATDENMYTLSVSISVLSGQYGENVGVILAGSTIMVVPIIIVFLLTQKFIIRSIVTTGLKF